MTESLMAAVRRGHGEPQPASRYVLMTDVVQAPPLAAQASDPRIVDAVETLLGGAAALATFVAYLKTPGAAGTGGDYSGSHPEAHQDYKPYHNAGSSLNWLFAIMSLVDLDEADRSPLRSPRIAQAEPGDRDRWTGPARAAGRRRRHGSAGGRRAAAWRPAADEHVHLACGRGQPLGPRPAGSLQQVPRPQCAARLRTDRVQRRGAPRGRPSRTIPDPAPRRATGHGAAAGGRARRQVPAAPPRRHVEAAGCRRRRRSESPDRSGRDGASQPLPRAAVGELHW